MLSTECHNEFWGSIAKLTGWRLAGHDGFDSATFFDNDGALIRIEYSVAELLDSLVCTIGDLSEDVLGLLETAKVVVDGTGKQKKLALKLLREGASYHRANVKSLRQDLPALFRHYDASECEAKVICRH